MRADWSFANTGLFPSSTVFWNATTSSHLGLPAPPALKPSAANNQIPPLSNALPLALLSSLGETIWALMTISTVESLAFAAFLRSPYRDWFPCSFNFWPFSYSQRGRIFILDSYSSYSAYLSPLSAFTSTSTLFCNQEAPSSAAHSLFSVFSNRSTAAILGPFSRLTTTDLFCHSSVTFRMNHPTCE